MLWETDNDTHFPCFNNYTLAWSNSIFGLRLKLLSKMPRLSKTAHLSMFLWLFLFSSFLTSRKVSKMFWTEAGQEKWMGGPPLRGRNSSDDYRSTRSYRFNSFSTRLQPDRYFMKTTIIIPDHLPPKSINHIKQCRNDWGFISLEIFIVRIPLCASVIAFENWP